MLARARRVQAHIRGGVAQLAAQWRIAGARSKPRLPRVVVVGPQILRCVREADALPTLPWQEPLRRAHLPMRWSTRDEESVSAEWRWEQVAVAEVGEGSSGGGGSR